jgi:glycosyltransferase involved in cell wall biosynthesis
LNINILPNPTLTAGIPGGVNSVVTDHAIGFLAAGHSINSGAGPTIVHALAQAEQIDVFHCHGLYPIGRDAFDMSYSRANDVILENALRAKVTVCISEFSANILRHKLHIDPHVTRNGIWTKEYSAGGDPHGAVLFPKVAIDANAKADDMLWLRDNADFPLLSIAKIPGVKSTGQLSRDEFLNVLHGSSIYLGTTKENSSMATMESMISGVPVVGYNTGFNSEWLISGNGCELVPAGDRVALKQAIAKVRSNWHKYSKAARDYAQIFDWQPVIDELLDLYQRVQTPEPAKVSIVIPVHNYARFLDEAIQSALAQTVPCEVIVVDDMSTDDSVAIAKRYPVKVICNEVNLKVAETRNRGIAAAEGQFIVCLDADDRLHQDYVEKHLAAFKTRQDAIAYAPIEIIDENGQKRNQRLFRTPARPDLHMIGRNQIPSCSMFRKSFWSRVGGYDKRYTPAEDAQFWLKIIALGGQAVRVGKEPLMDYRTGHTSLTSQGFPDWWNDMNLRFTSPIVERDPHITIVVTMGEGIEATLWSLEKQDYPNWSCKIQDANLNKLKGIFPWINRSISRQGSVLQVEAGEILPTNYLSKLVKQTPPWTRELRYQLA